MSFIVTKEWLENRLENNLEDTVVIDVRFDMGEPDAGKKAYLQSHIPHATYLDLNTDLSSPAGKHGGGHPLPEVHTLSEKLGKIGVNHGKAVVVYDQTNGMFAARAWWLLHYLGHENVYVLGSGFKGWTEAGNDVTDEVSVIKPTNFKPNILKDAIVDMEQVRENIDEKSAILIDSRSNDRYLGGTETMHAKSGHIPGAKNFFWMDLLNEDGTYKDAVELEKHFSSLSKEDEIIVSCGSGISACPNVMALKMLGYENIKLYPGSFSDWISYEENAIETKEE